MNALTPPINHATLLPPWAKRLLFVAILTLIANHLSGGMGLASTCRCTPDFFVWE
jgi:hypothetical protein